MQRNRRIKIKKKESIQLISRGFQQQVEKHEKKISKRD